MIITFLRLCLPFTNAREVVTSSKQRSGCESESESVREKESKGRERERERARIFLCLSERAVGGTLIIDSINTNIF